jgi:hypothetical protein
MTAVNIDFDFSGLSQEAKDVLLIGIADEKIPIKELFETCTKNETDKAIFAEFLNKIMELVGETNPLAYSLSKKLIKLLLR